MYVYVFGWSEKGPVKIGSAGNLTRRCVQLQIALPIMATMLRAIKTDGPAEVVERAAQRVLGERWLQGEWFDVTAGQAAAAIEAAAHGLSAKWRPVDLARWRAERVLADPHKHRPTARVLAVQEEIRRRTATLAKNKRAGCYTKAFKDGAVKAALESGNIWRTAGALNLRRETLQRWVSAARLAQFDTEPKLCRRCAAVARNRKTQSQHAEI